MLDEFIEHFGTASFFKGPKASILDTNVCLTLMPACKYAWSYAGNAHTLTLALYAV